MKAFLTWLLPIVFFLGLCGPWAALQAQTLTLSSSGEKGVSGTHWTSSGTHPVKITFTGTATIHPNVVIGFLNAGSDVLIEPAAGGKDIIVAAELSCASEAKLIFHTSGTIALRAQVTLGGAQIYSGQLHTYGNTKLKGAALCFNGSLFAAGHLHLEATQGDIVIKGDVQTKGSFHAQVLGALSSFRMGVDGVSGKGTTIRADKGISIEAQQSYLTGDLLTASHDINLSGDLKLAQFTVPESQAPFYIDPANGNLFLKGGTVTAYAGTLRDYAAETAHQMEKMAGFPVINLSNTHEASNTIGQYGLSLGRQGNQGDVWIANAVMLDGPITIHGHDISLTGALTAMHSTIYLHATGAVTQTASLTAQGLDLQGKGTFTLTHASNMVETITGGKPAAKLVSLAYLQTGNLSIGREDHAGIESTGPIHIATTKGNITIDQNISTASTAADAIIINPGQNKAPGEITGGSIRINGAPAITAGPGGVIQIYSGSKK